MDQAPAEALAAIESSAVAELPEDLTRQRRHLKARALAELDRGGEARTLLSGDDSEDALRLQADIFWNERDWNAAAEVLARLIPDPIPDDRPLSDLETQALVSLAVAHTLDGDQDALRSLDGRYGQAIALGPERDAFALLVSDLDAGTFRSIADELAGVEQIQSFLTSYRERLQQASLSELN